MELCRMRIMCQGSGFTHYINKYPNQPKTNYKGLCGLYTDLLYSVKSQSFRFCYLKSNYYNSTKLKSYKYIFYLLPI